MTNYAQGHKAEQIASDYLKGQGYDILDINWRTRRCEIDVIAFKDEVVRFVEVKYRQTSMQGAGLEYITPGKLRQMSFAAEIWVASHEWGGEYSLAAIELSGPEFGVTAFLAEI